MLDLLERPPLRLGHQKELGGDSIEFPPKSAPPKSAPKTSKVPRVGGDIRGHPYSIENEKLHWKVPPKSPGVYYLKEYLNKLPHVISYIDDEMNNLGVLGDIFGAFLSN